MKITKFLSFIVIILLTSCSFDNKTGIWKEHNKKKIDEVKYSENRVKIYQKDEKFDKEIDSKDLVILANQIKNFNWSEDNLNETNKVPHLYYNNKKSEIFKSKKIGNLKNFKDNIHPDLLIFNNVIYFSDLSGSIYSYSLKTKKIIWKFNFYKKKFNKIPIKVNLIINSKNLIAGDSLGYFYSIDIESGKLNWAKNQGVPITSEIKSFKNKIFLLNQDNKFYTFEQKEGNKILDFETFPVLLKKNNKQTMALDKKNNLYFVTSAGQIFSLNHKDYKINWLKSLKDTGSSEDLGIFYSSPIIVDNEMVFLSTSNTTLSINSNTGQTNWELPFGTRVKPIISNRFIFMISKSGFILNVDKTNGKVIWSKKIFKSENFNKKKLGEVYALMLLADQIFFATKKGYLFFVNYETGEIINYAKVAKGFYSKPIVSDGKILMIDKNMRLLIFN